MWFLNNNEIKSQIKLIIKDTNNKTAPNNHIKTKSAVRFLNELSSKYLLCLTLNSKLIINLGK